MNNTSNKICHALVFLSIFIYILSFFSPNSFEDFQILAGAINFLLSIIALPFGILLFLANPLYGFSLYFYKKKKYWLSFIVSGLAFLVSLQYYFPGRLNGPSDPAFNYTNSNGNFCYFVWVSAFITMIIASSIQMKSHKQIKKGFWRTLPFIGFTILCISFSSLLIFVYLHEVPKPPFNIKPKYHVVITGKIQKNKANPLTIIYQANYRSFHACHPTINSLEGNNDGSPDFSIYYPANPNHNGNYKVIIPLDAYKPGKCQWMISSIMYNTVLKIPGKKYTDPDEEWASILYFAQPKEIDISMKPDINHATILCGNDGVNSCRGLGLMSNYVKHLSRQSSYHYIQNIRFINSPGAIIGPVQSNLGQTRVNSKV